MKSVYGLLGIPESLAISLTLIAIAIALVPFFGGMELGPIKIPKLPTRQAHQLRFLGPCLALAALFCFVPAISSKPKSTPLPTLESADIDEATYASYVMDDPNWKPLGKLTSLSDGFFGGSYEGFAGSVWDGGPHWGTIRFDRSGRVATFTNSPGGSSGRILLQAAAMGTVPIYHGEWWQADGQKGFLDINMMASNLRDGPLIVDWGPQMNLTVEMKRLDNAERTRLTLLSGEAAASTEDSK